jgi:hypothetical protein
MASVDPVCESREHKKKKKEREQREEGLGGAAEERGRETHTKRNTEKMRD